jgi:uncharacterized protein DUF6600
MNAISIKFILSAAILGCVLIGNRSLQNANAQTEPAPPPNTNPSSDNAPASSTLPPDIDPNSPLAQVVSLAQAGVEQSVILNYINNSTDLFNLDSNKIIDLNDLGVPTEVINAMMQHDQQLEQSGAAPAQPPQPVSTTETAAQPAEVTVNYFYNTLAPYGAWVDVEGYGWCWRPTVVIYDTGWQPYCNNGHWVYTDHGWFWMSGYSWGWAAFHYGRWFRIPRYGWCWWPETTWAPSWVCWRYNNDYCGWAPLPPHAVYQPGVGFIYQGRAVGVEFSFGLGAGAFTFVRTRDFCDPQPWHHRIEAGEAEHIYDHTTPFHKIDFDRHDQTIINPGIPPHDITAVTKQEIHPVAVHYEGGGIAPGNRHEQFEQGGRELTVNRPHFVGSPELSLHPGAPSTTGHQNEFHPVVHGNENNLSPRPSAPAQNNYQHFNYQPPAANQNPAPNSEHLAPPTRQPEVPRVAHPNANNNTVAAPHENYSPRPIQNQTPYHNYNHDDKTLSPKMQQFEQPPPHETFQRVPQQNEQHFSAPAANHYVAPQNESRNNVEQSNHSQPQQQHESETHPSNHPSSSSSQKSGNPGHDNDQNGH